MGVGEILDLELDRAGVDVGDGRPASALQRDAESGADGAVQRHVRGHRSRDAGERKRADEDETERSLHADSYAAAARSVWGRRRTNHCVPA